MSETPDADVSLPPTSHDNPVFVAGVDGSPASKRAVEFATRRAVATGGRLVLVHVVDWRPYSFPTVEENQERPARRKQELEAAQQGLDPVAEEARAAGADVSTEVKFGHPAEAMMDVAHAEQATQVVVGRTGQTRLRTMLFGSTPSHLVQMADVPVTVIP